MTDATAGSAARVRRGSSAQGRAEVRRELVGAAARLFDERGYDDTTVDDIAAAAGVGRRTFFRYFRSKEDAISPDHESALARVAEVFAGAHPDEPAASLVLRAFGRTNGGTVRGDIDLADRFLNLFFSI